MQLSKILSALALLGAAIPSTYALSIKDDTVKLGIGIRLQTRATIADATDSAGGEFSVQSGTSASKNDPIDFSIRRSRLYLKIGYGDNWKGELAFSADNIDNTGSNTGRALSVRYAWAKRTWKMEGDMSHAIAFGLMKPYNNPSDSAMSSSRTLFPTENAASGLAGYREVGLEYSFNHPLFSITLDAFQNEAGADASGDNLGETEGFLLGARAEFSFSPEWFIAKRSESFLGKEGHGLNIGISALQNSDAEGNTGATGTPASTDFQRTTMAYGIDAMLWYNNISAYLEFRTMNVVTDGTASGTEFSDVDSEVIVAQVGYAFPLANGCVIEPAVRFQMIDNNTDADETPNYGSAAAEVGNSGTQIDLGVNYYLNGHDNKIQLALQLWEAEEGDADATIIRLQHQLNF